MLFAQISMDELLRKLTSHQMTCAGCEIINCRLQVINRHTFEGSLLLLFAEELICVATSNLFSYIRVQNFHCTRERIKLINSLIKVTLA